MLSSEAVVCFINGMIATAAACSADSCGSKPPLVTFKVDYNQGLKIDKSVSKISLEMN